VLAELALDTAFQDGLDERAEHAAVPCADEMDGGPHEGDPDHMAARHHPGQRLRPEVVEPGPQGEVRIVGVLGLDAYQVLDGVEGVQQAALQEELPGEQGTVEGAGAQHLAMAGLARAGFVQCRAGRVQCRAGRAAAVTPRA